jgi:AraC family transcriptional regulator
MLERQRTDLVHEMIQRNGEITARYNLAARLDSTASVTILVKLLDAARTALNCQQKDAEEYISIAAALLNRSGRREVADSQELRPGRHKLAPWQIRKAVEFIEANLSNEILIDDLARISHLSPTYFSKAFRSNFQVSPYAYILGRRVGRAQEMIALTDETLASIAVLCGFTDQSHMNRIFHRTVGTSPGGWRRYQRSPTTNGFEPVRPADAANVGRVADRRCQGKVTEVRRHSARPPSHERHL